MRTGVLAVETTQWIIAAGSLGSALIALAPGFGLKDWVVRPRVRLVLRHATDPDEINDRIVTKRLETGDTAAFVRLRVQNAAARHATSPYASSSSTAGIRRAPSGSACGQSSTDGCFSRPTTSPPNPTSSTSSRTPIGSSTSPRSTSPGFRRSQPRLRRDQPPLAAQRSEHPRAGHMAARAAGLRRQHQTGAIIRHALVRRDLAAGRVREPSDLGALPRPTGRFLSSPSRPTTRPSRSRFAPWRCGPPDSANALSRVAS